MHQVLAAKRTQKLAQSHGASSRNRTELSSSNRSELEDEVQLEVAAARCRSTAREFPGGERPKRCLSFGRWRASGARQPNCSSGSCPGISRSPGLPGSAPVSISGAARCETAAQDRQRRPTRGHATMQGVYGTPGTVFRSTLPSADCALVS